MELMLFIIIWDWRVSEKILEWKVNKSYLVKSCICKSIYNRIMIGLIIPPGEIKSTRCLTQSCSKKQPNMSPTMAQSSKKYSCSVSSINKSLLFWNLRVLTELTMIIKWQKSVRNCYRESSKNKSAKSSNKTSRLKFRWSKLKFWQKELWKISPNRILSLS